MRSKFFTGYILLLSIALSCFFTSCSDSRKNDAEIIKVMEESLNNSNRAINISTQTILHSLEEKTKDPVTSNRAAVWFPKAELIRKISVDLYNYIETLKTKEKINQPISNKLLQKLKTYKKEMLDIDSFIRVNFTNSIIISASADSSDISEKSFYNLFFTRTSENLKNGFLSKLQNSIRNLENRTITFCNEQISHYPFYFDVYSPIIGQNAQIIKKGSFIEITAGVGTFSTFAKPEITINGKIIGLNVQGVSIYKRRVTATPGKYKIPVKIKFTDKIGKENVIEKQVEYTVAKECNQ